METIIVAAIGLIGTLASVYFVNKKTTALILYRVDQLEQKVNKHNNLIDRMYKAESRIKVIKEEIEHLEHK